MQLLTEPSRQQFSTTVRRKVLEAKDLQEVVAAILQRVSTEGDTALHAYNKTFDNVTRDSLKIAQHEIDSAKEHVPRALQEAIQLAAKNIETFHAAQKEQCQVIETMPGVSCWRESRPISSVGLYVPAGSAPLFSTVLMLAIPARLAACETVSICTPANEQDSVHPAILFAAHVAGVHNIFAVGGAQAIAAMAYGTETVPQADKIFGPGNQYVTQAKQLIAATGTAIDMPAGPTELAIYADDTADAAAVAADVLAQLEHGIDSQVVLFVPNRNVYTNVAAAIERQLPALDRQAIVRESLQNSFCVSVFERERVAELINIYAPEHLILNMKDARAFSAGITNAGSVFIGPFAAESLGDYATGTNHTLPTNGAAKAFSGVSLDSFLKKITFQEVSSQGLQNIGPAVEMMAKAEHLQGHAAAVRIRLEKLSES